MKLRRRTLVSLMSLMGGIAVGQTPPAFGPPAGNPASGTVPSTPKTGNQPQAATATAPTKIISSALDATSKTVLSDSDIDAILSFIDDSDAATDSSNPTDVAPAAPAVVPGGTPGKSKRLKVKAGPKTV